MLAVALAITLLVVGATTLRGQASPNMAPGYQQTYDRMLQQIRQIAIFDDLAHDSQRRGQRTAGTAICAWLPS
jgi:hypothetical protein